MPRKVNEWRGKTPDTRAPPRVLLRVFQRVNGICHISGRKIMPGERWQAEHIVALINGGENRESNLAPALVGPHKEKTRRDLAEKKRVAKRAKSHVGVTRPAGEIKSRGFAPSAKPEREPLPVVNGLTGIARRYSG
jgi:hypothetical protein